MWLALLLPLLWAVPALGHACAGDFDNDRQITISDILRSVNIALGNVSCYSYTPTPVPRFQDTGLGTIRDNRTGLIWEKRGTWQSSDPPHHRNQDSYPSSMDFYDWFDARDELNLFNAEAYGGRTDWRFPTIAEITSLHDPERGTIAQGFARFSGDFCRAIQPDCNIFGGPEFWTSEEASPGNMYVVDLYQPRAPVGVRPKTSLDPIQRFVAGP